MLAVSIMELANQVAVERKASVKERAELLEKAKLAVEKAQKVDWFLSKMINVERITRMKILEVLGDENARGWNEIERETGLSPSTLSRGLKAMIKDGWINRDVISKFPPRSVYTINESAVGAGRFFRKIRNTIARNFFIEMTGKFNNEEIIESVHHNLHIAASNNLRESLLTFKRDSYHITDGMIFFATYYLLMYFWSLFMSVTRTKELTEKALDTFMDEVKRYEEELKMVNNVIVERSKENMEKSKTKT